MNKILSYSFTACAAVLALSACSLEEDNIFESSAADRLNEASVLYGNRLIDSKDGWALEYYANDETDIDAYIKGVGYLMCVKFDKDMSVRVGMANELTADKKYDEDISSWEVITDMGAVLSFNTYNRILHTFSVPEDIKGTSDDETGRGMEGDYEFVLVDVPEGGDYVLLKGKKSKAYSRLTRLSANTDFAEYISDVTSKQNDLLSNAAPNHLVMNVGEKQYYFIMPQKGGELGLTKLWPAGTDSTFTMVLNPLLTTRHVAGNDTTYVIRFRDKIAGSQDGSELSVQEFRYDPQSNSFITDDENINIVGENPAIFFAEKWGLNARFSISASSDGSQKAKDLVSAVFAGYKAIKYTLQNIQIQKSGANTATVTLNYRTNKNATGKAVYNYNSSVEDGKLTLSYVEPANNASQTQMNSIEAISAFLQALNGTYQIGAGRNSLNLSTISFQKVDDADFCLVPTYSK